LNAFRVTDTTNYNWHEFGQGDNWAVFRKNYGNDGWLWQYQSNAPPYDNYITAMSLNGFGHLGINGSASSAYVLYADQDLSNYTAYFNNTSNAAGGHGLRIRAGLDAYASSSTDFILFEDGDGGNIGHVRGTGGAGVEYATSSDARLKKNVQDFVGALDTVKQMRPVKFEWKSGEPVNEDVGFIAQELEPVYPYVVSGDPNADVKENPMSIDYGQLTPLLTAAIQEQQEIIEDLKTRIEILENNLK
jgi:hypothetical protein